MVTSPEQVSDINVFGSVRAHQPSANYRRVERLERACLSLFLNWLTSSGRPSSSPPSSPPAPSRLARRHSRRSSLSATTTLQSAGRIARCLRAVSPPTYGNHFRPLPCPVLVSPALPRPQLPNTAAQETHLSPAFYPRLLAMSIRVRHPAPPYRRRDGRQGGRPQASRTPHPHNRAR